MAYRGRHATLIVPLLVAFVLFATLLTEPPVSGRPLTGPIADKYQSLGGASGPLGAALSDVRDVGDGVGQYADFQNGFIYWTPSLGAHAVYGEIGVRWNQMGRVGSPLGYPVSDELSAPGGRYNEFQSGFIYWSVATGAHAVYGRIGEKWNQMGRVGSPLGYPTVDEWGSGLEWRVSEFQGGWIYWTPGTDAHAVYGAIFDKWQELFQELGAPTTDELEIPGQQGARYADFKSGSVYWNSRLGAHAVYGKIGEKYNQMGRTQSCLGFPKSDEYSFRGYRVNTFEHGWIKWTLTGGADARCATSTPPCPNNPGGLPRQFIFCQNCPGGYTSTYEVWACTEADARAVVQANGTNCQVSNGACASPIVRRHHVGEVAPTSPW